MPPQNIPVDCLCIGLFIQLNLKWMGHPFIFNSFKIKSDDQIQTLKELGVKQVLYIPEKSDCRPTVSKGPVAQDKAPPGAAPTPG